MYWVVVYCVVVDMVDVFDCDICSVFDVGGVEVFGVLFDIGMGVV